MPKAVGHGYRGNELILVLPKRGESPKAALSRVGARHPGVTFRPGPPAERGGLPAGVLDLISTGLQIIGAFVRQFGTRHPVDSGTHRNSLFADGTSFIHYMNDDETIRMFGTLYRLAAAGCTVLWPSTHSWSGAVRWGPYGQGPALEVWDAKTHSYIRAITLPSRFLDATLAFVASAGGLRPRQHAVVRCGQTILWTSPDPSRVPQADVVIHPG